MEKTLKFALDLVPLVLSGEKDTTWRLWDDKDLQKGDVVTLVRRPELEPFAEAKLTSVVEKLIGELTERDKKGHEAFESDEQMYATYSNYYDTAIGPETSVKVVRFKLIREVRT